MCPRQPRTAEHQLIELFDRLQRCVPKVGSTAARGRLHPVADRGTLCVHAVETHAMNRFPKTSGWRDVTVAGTFYGHVDCTFPPKRARRKFHSRTHGRSNMLRSLLLAALTLATASTAVAQDALRIDLNIPAHKLVVYEGDRVIETYPIAVGMPGFDTPTGEFAITHAEWNPWWHPPTHREWARNEKPTPPGPRNPMGRVKLFFLPMYFIHGTPEGESIGTPASHGCVRMLNSDVIELSKLLHERAAPNVSDDEIDRILSRPGTTRRVNFTNEVEVVVRYDPIVVEHSEILVYPDIYNRRAIHTENVYQALMRAGYDVSRIDHDDVRRFVDRAQDQKAPLVLKLEDAFGDRLALAGS